MGCMDVLHNIGQEVRVLETLVYGFLGIWCTDSNGMYGFSNIWCTGL